MLLEENWQWPIGSKILACYWINMSSTFCESLVVLHRIEESETWSFENRSVGKYSKLHHKFPVLNFVIVVNCVLEMTSH